MSWRVATDVVWAVIALGICALVVASRWPAVVPSAGFAVRRVMARPAARVAVLLVWMWLGWHTFAR